MTELTKLTKREKSKLVKFIEYSLDLNELPWESSDLEIQQEIDRIRLNATNIFLNQKGLNYEHS